MKALVNSYITTGQIAPQILFANGPGASAYVTARDALYGWNATPTFQINGSGQQLGWSQSSVQNLINNQLSLPCHVEIDMNIVGDASGGTAYYTVTIEQDPGVTGVVKIWSAIVESHEIAGSAYGVYNGQELMWEPRAWPMGSSGTVIDITGPYPKTIDVSGTYTLDPTLHTFDNLEVVTYVQANTGTHAVLNASFEDLPDTATGIGDLEGAAFGSLSINAWPNPSTGTVNVGTLLPGGDSGQVSIYNTAGRLVARFDAGGVTPVAIDESGVYFARLEASGSEAVLTRFTVVR